MPVPDRLATRRLLLRPWRATDAALVQSVLEANANHLGPWIPPRVAAPVPLDGLTSRLAGFGEDFASGREWRYGVFSPDETAVYGEVGLYPRTASERVHFAGADRVEMGYWLRSDVTGRGFATEAARVLLEVASAIGGMICVEIRCDTRNAASAAVPRRLRFRLVETVSSPGIVPGDACVQLQLWEYKLATAATEA
jgi:RimJ/RimL family protein N-acetyltransferase